jgi:hypothetical protein
VRRRALASAFAALAVAAEGAAAELTPATLARLAGQGSDAAAQEQWRAGLRHTDARVRAAAARAAHVSAALPLVPDLATALAVESDLLAGAEMARAVASLGTYANDGGVLEAARRIGGDLPAIVGDALGRTRGARALAHLATLRDTDTDGRARRALVRAVAHAPDTTLGSVAEGVLQTGDSVAWAAVVELTREGHDLDPALLSRGGPLTPTAAAAAASPSLTEEWQIRTERPVGPRVSPAAERDRRLRAGGTFPPGYATGVMEATRCRARGDWVGVDVQYGTDGRPRRIGIPGGLSDQCREAAGIIAMSSLAPGGHFPAKDQPETLLVPLDKEWLACLEAESPGAPPSPLDLVAPRRQSLEQPKKTRNAHPIYPDRAKTSFIEGDVEFDTLIGRSGCVYDIRARRGPTLLAAAAIRAISAWRYTPTRVDGRPVVAPMTVRMTFFLE